MKLKPLNVVGFCLDCCEDQKRGTWFESRDGVGFFICEKCLARKRKEFERDFPGRDFDKWMRGPVMP